MGENLKNTGKFFGKVAGSVLQAPFAVTGEIFSSPFLKEVGNSVKAVTVNTGKVLGDAASGTYEIASGLITKDNEKAKEGVSDFGRAVGNTAKGIGLGIANILENSGNVISGAIEGDKEKVKESSKQLLKTAVVATFAVGIVEFGPDVVEGIDTTIDNIDDTTGLSSTQFEETYSQHQMDSTFSTGMNYVDPYYRDDGTFVEGHYRANPDGILSNNLNFNKG